MTFQQLVKVLCGVLIIPFLIVSCNKDDDDNPDPNQNQNPNQQGPAVGTAELTTDGTNEAMPDSVFFTDTTDLWMGFEDTADHAIIVEGENDSVSLTLEFYSDTTNGKIQAGTYPARYYDDNSNYTTGVEVAVFTEGTRWEQNSGSFTGEPAGNVEIKSRSGNNVYGEFNEVELKKNFAQETFTINGEFNAKKKN